MDLRTRTVVHDRGSQKIAVRVKETRSVESEKRERKMPHSSQGNLLGCAGWQQKLHQISSSPWSIAEFLPVLQRSTDRPSHLITTTCHRARPFSNSYNERTDADRFGSFPDLLSYVCRPCTGCRSATFTFSTLGRQVPSHSTDLSEQSGTPSGADPNAIRACSANRQLSCASTNAYRSRAGGTATADHSRPAADCAARADAASRRQAAKRSRGEAHHHRQAGRRSERRLHCH